MSNSLGNRYAGLVAGVGNEIYVSVFHGQRGKAIVGFNSTFALGVNADSVCRKIATLFVAGLKLNFGLVADLDQRGATIECITIAPAICEEYALGHIRRNGDRSKRRAVVECFCTNSGDHFGKFNTSQVNALCKCLFTNGDRLGASTLKYECFKAFKTIEESVADRCNRIGNYKVNDYLLCGDHNDARAVSGIEDTVDCLVGNVSGIYVERCNTRVLERIASDNRNACGNGDLGKTCAAVEEILCQLGRLTSEIYFSESGALPESALANVGCRFGNNDALKRSTVSERIHTNGAYGCGKLDGLKTAALEGVVTNFSALAAVLKVNALKGGNFKECRRSFFFRTLFSSLNHSNVCGNSKGLQRGVCEGTCGDLFELRVGCKSNRLQRRAGMRIVIIVIEYTCTKSLKACREAYGNELATACKGMVANADKTFLEGNIQQIITMIECKTTNVNNACRNCKIDNGSLGECIIANLYECAILCKGNRGKSRLLEGIIANAVSSCRESESVQRIVVSERLVANDQEIIAALIEGNGVERFTVSECLLIDLLNGRRNVYFLKCTTEVKGCRLNFHKTFGKNDLFDAFIAVECACINNLYVSINNEFFIRLCERINNQSRLICTVENAVNRRVVSALTVSTYVDRSKLAATANHRRIEIHQTCGKRKAYELGTTIECFIAKRYNVGRKNNRGKTAATFKRFVTNVHFLATTLENERSKHCCLVEGTVVNLDYARGNCKFTLTTHRIVNKLALISGHKNAVKRGIVRSALLFNGNGGKAATGVEYESTVCKRCDLLTGVRCVRSKSCGKNDGGKKVCIFKCVCSNGKRSISAHLKGEGGKRVVQTVECISTDTKSVIGLAAGRIGVCGQVAYTLGNYERFQTGAVKALSTNGGQARIVACNGNTQSVYIITCKLECSLFEYGKTGRKLYCLQIIAVVKYVTAIDICVVGSHALVVISVYKSSTKHEILCTVFKDNLFKASISESICANGLDGCGNGNFGKVVGCIVAGFVSKCKRTDALDYRSTCKGNITKLFTSIESIVANGLYRCGDNELRNVNIAFECTVADVLKHGAFNGERNIRIVISAAPPTAFSVTAETVRTNGLYRCGNGNVKLCAPECIVTESNKALVEHDGVSSGLVECRMTDGNGVRGKCECAKLCISECVCTNGKRTGSFACKYDRIDICRVERIVTDNSNGIADGKGTKGYVLEYTVSDGSNSCGKLKVTVLALREEYDLGHSLIVYNAVNRGEVLRVRVNINSLKRGTSREYTGNLVDVCREIYCSKGSTIHESILAKGESSFTCCKGYTLKRSAVCKCSRTNRGHACGESEFLQIFASLECTVTKLSQTAALAKGYGCKILTIHKGILFYLKIIKRTTVKGKCCKIFEAVECTLADQNKRTGKRYFADGMTSNKRTCRNVSRTLGYNERTLDGCGNKEECSAILRIKDAVDSLVILVVRGYVDRLKRGATDKCVVALGGIYDTVGNRISLKLDFGKSCGKSDLFKLCAVHKRSCSDRKRSGRAFGIHLKYYGGEVCVILESFSANGGYLCGNDNLGNRRTGKCCFGNFGNACRNAERSGLCHRYKSNLGLACGTDVKKYTIYRCKYGCCNAFYFVYIDCSKRRAALEGRDQRNLLDGFGKIDNLKVGAVSKSVTCNKGYGQAAIGCGNGQLGNKVDSRALGYRISLLAVYLRQSKGKRFVDPERIELLALCQSPGCKAITALIGVLNTHAVRSGEPAAKCTCNAACSRNDERVVAVKAYQIGGESAGSANAVVVNNFVFLCVVIAVEYDITAFGEDNVLISCTVAQCATGNIIPSYKIITCLLGNGENDGITDSLELSINGLTAKRIKGNTVSDYGRADPLGSVLAVNEANLYKVFALLVEGYECGVYAALCLDDLTVVYLNLIVVCSDNGSPGKLTVSVRNLIAHLVVRSNKLIGYQRIGCALCLNSERVFNAFDNIYHRSEVEGVGGAFVCNTVYGYFILLCSGNCVPTQNIANEKKICRRSENSLGINELGSSGRIVTFGLRINLNNDTAFSSITSLKAYESLRTKVNKVVVVRGVAALNRNHIAFCRCNLVPNKGLGSFVKTEAANAIKVLGNRENVRCRGSVAICYCGNGKLNTVCSHGAVSKVEGSGRTVIKCSVIMVGIATHYGDNVLLCIFNGVEYEHGAIYKELGNLIKGLVYIVSCSSGVVLLAGISLCSNDDLVLACIPIFEGNIQNGSGYRGINHNLSILCDDLNVISSRTVNGIPANVACIHVNNGYCELGISRICDPKRVESGVSVNRHIVLILIGKLAAVGFGAEPPTAEGIAFSIKNRQTKELAACSKCSLESRSALVVRIQLYGELLAGHGFSDPSCIDGRVSGYGSSAKCVSGLKLGICIPANKYKTGAGRICGLGCALTVQNGLSSYFTTAVNVKVNGVVDLFQETHTCILICKRDNAAFVCSGYVTHTLCVKVEHELAVGKRVLTCRKHALYVKGKGVTNVKCQCVFEVYIIKVVNSGFRPFGLSRFVVAVIRYSSRLFIVRFIVTASDCHTTNESED